MPVRLLKKLLPLVVMVAVDERFGIMVKLVNAVPVTTVPAAMEKSPPTVMALPDCERVTLELRRIAPIMVNPTLIAVTENVTAVVRREKSTPGLHSSLDDKVIVVPLFDDASSTTMVSCGNG